MSMTHALSALTRYARSAFVGAAVVASFGMLAPQPVQALTIVLNFVDSPTQDRNGVNTIPETFANWGFTGLTDLNAIYQATLELVQRDYLSYPNWDQDPLSPLPPGMELDINFTFSNGLTGPGNGDLEYYYMNIGDANPNVGFLGQACLGCVRNAAGNPTVPVGTIFGSTLSDSISTLLPLASNDFERMNLLGGTAAHEIGHALGLVHPSGQAPNPGQSLWSIMATGASPSLMPSTERIKDRDFSYAEFGVLINRVGLREVTPIPEPGTYLMLALGLAVLVWRVQGARRQH